MQTWIELCTSYQKPTVFERDTKMQLFDTYFKMYGPHNTVDSDMLPNQHSIVSDQPVPLSDAYFEMYDFHVISSSHMLPNQHTIVSNQAMRYASARVRTFMETYDHVNIGVVLGLEILPEGRCSWVRLIAVMSDLEHTIQVADTYRVNLEDLLDMHPDRFESWAVLVNQQGQNHHQRRRQLIERAYELLGKPVAVPA